MDTQYYNSSDNTCVTCANGTYSDLFSGSCISCQTNCSLCEFNSTENKSLCSQCTSGSFLNSTGGCEVIAVCLPGFYYNSTYNTCSGCGTACVNCTDPNNCYSCNSSYFLEITSSSCVVKPNCSATASQYYNESDNSCHICGTNCLSCSFNISTDTVSQCNQCDQGYTLNFTDKSDCILQAICNTSQYFNYSDNTCGNCPTNCTNCSLNSANYNIVECHNCSNNSFFNSSHLTCDPVPSCPTSTYYNTTLNDCPRCSLGCLTCSGDYNCSACYTNYFYNSSTLACDVIPTCQNGSFSDPNDNLCHNCSANCTYCE